MMRSVSNVRPHESVAATPQTLADHPRVDHTTACRVVTTSETARLLLAGQLKAFPGISWSVVSGDRAPVAPEGVEATYHVPMRRDLSISDFRSLVQLFRFFRAHRFHFVQTHTPKASLLGLPAARCSGMPALYTMHGSLFFRDNVWKKNIAPWLFERWCCMWATEVLVQSREDAELLHRVGICPKRKIVYIGNGINVARYSPAPYPPIIEGKPIVLMIGRLVVEKGTRDFFRIAQALHGKARFVHIGPTEHDQHDAIPAAELEQVAASGHVEFVGQVDDVRPHIARSHLVVLPSFREGIPRAAMEAAAMGRPVAGYDIRGMREVIPRRLELLVPKGDVSALERLVCNLLTDLERLPVLGLECRDAVVAEFSEDLVVKRLHAVYAGLGAL